jgi:RNA polymerase sigma factor (sigma-70 family)
MGEAENHALPAAANESWRTWLMTGSRRDQPDRRRLRGAHRGLKKMLIEGMTIGGDKPYAWKEFSGAMIRHAVDEAMRELPLEEKKMVKLAYFGGMSNREIAELIGVTEAAVRRRLSRAVDAISDYIERGRTFGRRAFYALTLWLCGRWVDGATHHAVQAVVVVSAAAVIAAQPAAQVPQTPDIPPAHRAPALAAPDPHAEPATHASPANQNQVAPPRPTPAITETKPPIPKLRLPVVEVPKVDLPRHVAPLPANPPAPGVLPI